MLLKQLRHLISFSFSLHLLSFPLLYFVILFSLSLPPAFSHTVMHEHIHFIQIYMYQALPEAVEIQQ